MAQAPQSDSGSPFPGLILVLVMSAGAIWVQKVPLPSARPAEPMVTAERYAAQQDIDSRLWQDPFEAVKKAATKSDPVIDADIKQALLKLSGASQSIIKPRAEINLCKDLSPKDQVRVMAVMVNGAPYAEAAEARRRTRYAVISGLGRSDYVPVDREHIGLVTATLNAQSSNTRSAGIKTAIPYEWFYSASAKEKRVLVLWINETQIRDQPLHYLNKILVQSCSLKSGPKTVIIGPGSSDTLSAMWREVQPLIANNKSSDMTSVLPGDFLKNVQIYSPKATVPDEHLFQEIDVPNVPSNHPPSPSDQPNTITNALKKTIGFHRTIATDYALMDTLTKELARRDVHTDDGIVLISEWDTSYGRTLPKAFEMFKENLKKRDDSSQWFLFKVLKKIFEEKPIENNNVVKATLRHYSYLRGLDGMLPGENADKKSDENKKTREKNAPEIESAFGNHQKDYLRRIAARVDDLDHEMKDGGKKKGSRQ